MLFFGGNSPPWHSRHIFLVVFDRRKNLRNYFPFDIVKNSTVVFKKTSFDVLFFSKMLEVYLFTGDTVYMDKRTHARTYT